MKEIHPRQEKPRKNARSSRRVRPKGSTRVIAYSNWLGLGRNLALTVLDVSETGIRILLQQEMLTGHEFELHLHSVASKSYKILAEVIWSIPAADGTFVIGAKFQKPISYAALQSFAKL